MSVIEALLYLANCTRPNIAFAVNLLARFNASPTRRHWNDIKHVFLYLQGSQDLGLLYTRNQYMTLVGYLDAGYMSDPHNVSPRLVMVFSMVVL